MATFQQRENLLGGLVRLRIVLTAQTSTSVSDAITDVPPRGVIRRFDARLTAGTGTTIDPQISRSASVFTVPDLLSQPLASPGSPAATASTAAAVPYVLDGSSWYIRPQPNNAAADHTIEFEILIDPGARS